ncbi:aryl-alcohol dehydrogenase [Luminiphilus syltensis NOR5-1B]|uniref:Aryl-alcohol dehydrogenase n=1 Tax=Luminiphilus syltensis NOR5-1B TaxID=565045 RepID=B8KQH5_9GAMM|nr:NAD(P)-dependent alcohol dehydrogenase [Luminiphilus syltensis]EED36709.1 aryl-alcohol dehydrogenase [Luminiphilus syltensis NOR5-1B]
MMKAIGAVIEEPGGVFQCRDFQLADPRADEVLVEIAGCGVCHTDLVCRDQGIPVPTPCILGHEGSGVVKAVGSAVSRVSPGDHVVLSYQNCGECQNCLKGAPAYCLDFFARNFSGCRPDGSIAVSALDPQAPLYGHFFCQSSFATHAIAHERNTVKVPSDAPLELLGPLGCGIQTGAGAVLNSLKPRAGSSIVIFGAGSVGLSAVMAANLVGCGTIIAVDPVASRRSLALELGATAVIDPQPEDPLARVSQLTTTGADFSLECTGKPDVLRAAVECLIPSGVCGIIGAAPLGTEVSLNMTTMATRTIKGIVEGESDRNLFIPTLVDLYQQGRFPFDRLITFYPLADIQRAVADTESGRVLKAVLRPA